MNQINIVGEDAGSKCCNTDPVGIHIIIISVMENLIIILNNSLFYGLHHTAIRVRDRCHGNNTIIIENCTFERNGYRYSGEDFLVPIIPLIDIVLSHSNKSIIFKQCSFKMNYNNHYLLYVLVQATEICNAKKLFCNGLLTNITLVNCRFTDNFSKVINIIAEPCTANLFIIGPSHVVHNMIHSGLESDVILVSKVVVHLVGLVTISSKLIMVKAFCILNLVTLYFITTL